MADGDLLKKTYANIPASHDCDCWHFCPQSRTLPAVPPQETPNTHRQVWLSLFWESLGVLVHTGFVCALQASLLPSVMWKFCNQTLQFCYATLPSLVIKEEINNSKQQKKENLEKSN